MKTFNITWRIWYINRVYLTWSVCFRNCIWKRFVFSVLIWQRKIWFFIRVCITWSFCYRNCRLSTFSYNVWKWCRITYKCVTLNSIWTCYSLFDFTTKNNFKDRNRNRLGRFRNRRLLRAIKPQEIIIKRGKFMSNCIKIWRFTYIRIFMYIQITRKNAEIIICR